VSRSGGTVSATTEESFDIHLTMVGCVSVEIEGGIELEKNFVIFEIRDLLAKFNPLSPPSDPVQRRLQSPPAKSNFLGACRTLSWPENLVVSIHARPICLS
jgi:hypothetical protein